MNRKNKEVRRTTSDLELNGETDDSMTWSAAGEKHP